MPKTYERYTADARAAVELAEAAAVQLGHGRVGTEHLLLGLLQVRRGVAAQALLGLGVTPAAVDTQLAAQQPAAAAPAREPAPTGRKAAPGAARPPPHTVRLDNVLALAVRQALRLGSNEISSGHLLLSLIDEPGCGGRQVLVSLGADPADLRRRMTRLLARTAAEETAGPKTTP